MILQEDVFQLKEVEKRCSKEKGISECMRVCDVCVYVYDHLVSCWRLHVQRRWRGMLRRDLIASFPATQSVEEILKSLVDDGLVDTDKVGTSNYFWAFPSKGGQAVR